MASSFYALTRRRGKSGTLTQVTEKTSVPETGVRTPTTFEHTIRFLFKTQTRNSRIYSARAVNQDVGETTFLIWHKDITLDATKTLIDSEDYITLDSKRYNILTADFEDSEGWMITANQIRSQ